MLEESPVVRPEFSGRNHSIDGLRTAAVLLVVVYHTFFVIVRGGSIGVDLFFVISGYVITLLLLREWERTGRIRFRRFYLNRLARLWPALLVVCVAVVLQNALAPGVTDERVAALGAAFYFTNIARGLHLGGVSPASALGHTWSLAVEEQFYLVWPVVFVLLAAWFRRTRAGVVVYLLALVPLILRAVLWQGGAGLDHIYNMPDTRADQLLIGCGLAFVLPAIERSARGSAALRALTWPCAVILVVIAVSVPLTHLTTGSVGAFVWIVGPLVTALLAGTVLGGLVVAPRGVLGRALGWKPIAWCGRELSYGIYLWHFPLVVALAPIVIPPVARLVIVLGATFGLAFLSHRFLERPVRIWARAALDRRTAALLRRIPGTKPL